MWSKILNQDVIFIMFEARVIIAEFIHSISAIGRGGEALQIEKHIVHCVKGVYIQ